MTAFLITSSANDCVFKGFDVAGVQITITGVHTQSENFRVAGGSRNRFEQLALRDGNGNGWYLTSGSSNLVLNCDAYNNRGVDGGSIGNIDGFGAHPNSTSGQGNVIQGCRAWFNSDDGFDLISARAAVTIDNCWAFYNGYYFTLPVTVATNDFMSLDESLLTAPRQPNGDLPHIGASQPTPLIWREPVPSQTPLDHMSLGPPIASVCRDRPRRPN